MTSVTQGSNTFSDLMPGPCVQNWIGSALGVKRSSGHRWRRSVRRAASYTRTDSPPLAARAENHLVTACHRHLLRDACSASVHKPTGRNRSGGWLSIGFQCGPVEPTWSNLGPRPYWHPPSAVTAQAGCVSFQYSALLSACVDQLAFGASDSERAGQAAAKAEGRWQPSNCCRIPRLPRFLAQLAKQTRTAMADYEGYLLLHDVGRQAVRLRSLDGEWAWNS